jgi:hypothetical protein
VGKKKTDWSIFKMVISEVWAVGLIADDASGANQIKSNQIRSNGREDVA